MSRLDSFIRRLEAQRNLLNWAIGAIADRPGLVLEIGLGNGRTYDHLRAGLAVHPIYAFDRACNANPLSVPPADRLILGEFSETLPAFAARQPRQAVLVHCDVGLGDAAANARQVAMMGRLVPPLLAAGGIVLSDQLLENSDLELCEPPVQIPSGRYFVYTKSKGGS